MTMTYNSTGKSLETALKMSVSKVADLVQSHSSEIWTLQFKSALIALSKLHDAHYSAGSFNCRTIFFSDTDACAADARLFTPNLRHMTDVSGHYEKVVKTPQFYSARSTCYSVDDDVVAAALTFIKLRLWDEGQTNVVE